MKKTKRKSDEDVLLRQKAEQLLKNKRLSKTVDISEADTIKLLYELEVHQIELELQNEELQLAMEKAETNAEKYTNLYDFAPSGYFTLDSEFRVYELNLYGAKMLGKERSKLINNNFILFIALNKRIAFTNFLDKVLKSKTKQSCEVRLTINEKSSIFAHIDCIFSETEQTYLLTLVDITERKQAEEKLRDSEEQLKKQNIELLESNKNVEESNERFNLAMKATTDGLWDWDLITDEIYYSPHWKSMLGYADHELPNNFSIWEKLTTEEDVKKSWDMLHKHIAGKLAKFDMEFKMQHKKGHWVDISSRATAFRDEKGKAYRVVGTHTDITEKTKAKLQLQKSEELFRKMMDNMPSGVAIYKAVNNANDFEFIKLNKKAEEITKKPENEIIGHTLLEEFPNMKNGSFIKSLKKISKDGVSIYIPPFFYKDNQRQGWRENYIYKLASGEIVAIFNDVTEKIESEQELKESEDKYRSLVEGSLQGMAVVLNNPLRIVYASSPLEKMSGYSPEEFESFGPKELTNIIYKDDRESLFRDFADRIAGKYLEPNKQYRINHKDGSIRWIQFYSISMRYKNEAATQAVFIDITEQKETEIALDLSEIRHRLYLENAPLGIFVVNSKGKYIDVNPGACKLLGYTKEELIKLSITDVSNPNNTTNTFQQLLKEGSVSYEGGLKRKDGSLVEVRLDAVALPNDQFIAFCSDITERKQIENELLVNERILNEVGVIAKIGGWEMDLKKEGKATWTKGTYDIVEINQGDPIPGAEEHIDFYLPEFREMINTKMQELIETKQSISYEAQFKTKNGKLKWVRAIGETVVKNGKVVKLRGTLQDITERKQAELKLQESEKKRRDWIENSPACTKVLDLNLNLQFMSQAGIAGLKIDDISKYYGKPFPFSFYPKSLKISITKKLNRAIETGEKIMYEEPIFDLEGGKVWFHTTIIPVKNNKGEIEYLLVTSVDTTKQNEAKEKLKESENKFRAIFEQAAVGVAIIDTDTGRFLQINQKYCNICGYSKNEMSEIDLMKITHPDDLELDLINMQKIKQGLISEFSINKRYLKKDKSVIWVRLSVSVLNKVDNKVKRHIAIIEDISKQKKAAQKLKNAKGEADRYLYLSGSAFVSLDRNGDLLLVNQKCLEVLEYDKSEELEGKNWFDTCIPSEISEQVKQVFAKVMKGEMEGVEYFENEVVTKSGKRRLIYWTNSYIKDEKGQIKTLLSSGIDITERKQVEEKLYKSMEQLDMALEGSNAGSWSWNIKTGEDLLDERWCAILGYTKDEIKQHASSWERLMHPDDKDRIADVIKKHFEDENNEYNHDYRMKCKNGEWKWIHALGKVIDRDVDGEPARMSGIIIDISERKVVENALSQSEIKFRALYDNAPLSYQSLNEDGSFNDINPTWLSTLGYERNEVISQLYKDFLHPHSQSHFEVKFPEFKKRGYVNDVEFKIRHKAGHYLDISFNGCISYNLDGSFKQTYCVFHDITEKKKVEEALKESEEKLNTLFNSLTEVVVMHELVLNEVGEAINYRIIDCNKAFTEFLGISKEDAIGKLVTEVFQSEDPPYLEEYSKVALGGDSYEFTSFYAPLDRHLMISVVSPRAGKFATITTDITLMMQIQETIVAKNKEMGNYLYIVSHDLRSPLLNIQGFSQRFKKQTDSLKTLIADKKLEPEILHQLANITDENIPKTLDFIFSNIEKMDTLMKGLLKLSRTGRMEMIIKKIDMNGLFAKIFHSLDFQINEANCEILVNPLPECYGDAALLDQLFTNIVNNALNYFDAERPLEITVDAKKSINGIIYSIKDTGKGIDQKHLYKIWDVFYRVDPKSSKPGEGIGLSMVKQIVEKHKGKIWVESEKDIGSVFHIELNNRKFTEI